MVTTVKVTTIVIAAILLGDLLAAQDPVPVPTFRTDANYVRVDVYPTRGGTPVDDLAADDFELLEGNVPQKIDQFQHVVAVRSSSANLGREPATVSDSRQLVRDSQGRVFVVFLDPRHVDVLASRNIAPPLVKALHTLLAPDDLVAVMVPGMSVRDLTFARNTTMLENVLARDWWGTRDRVLPGDDPVENAYASCYPGVPAPGTVQAADQGIAQEMILRRREEQTLDTLQELAGYLRTVREGRKTVLAITDGWVLYRPNPALARPLDKTPPQPVGIEPRGGQPTSRLGNASANDPRQACERDRIALSELDSDTRLRTIIDDANRSNTSFYPIDPRGLAAFDENIVPAAGVGVGPQANPTLTPSEESRRLASRASSLRQLAEGTDGFATVGTNDLAAGLRRITTDIGSYYLLGYYATSRLDGQFHRITVRVKRPGVSVRARRGYQALRASDVTAVKAAPAASMSNTDVERRGVLADALASVAGLERSVPLRAQATVAWRTDVSGGPRANVWVIGEIADRVGGADAEVSLMDPDGRVVAVARSRIEPSSTTAVLSLAPPTDLAPGEYGLRLVTRGANSTETVTLSVTLPSASDRWSGALWYRRGPGTANRDAPTADRRYRRTERLRVDVPSGAPVSAQLLDRMGKPLPVPVALSKHTDSDGTTWTTAGVTLASLAQGDYVIEFVSEGTSTMFGVRVVP